jgi:hypothetical protein
MDSSPDRLFDISYVDIDEDGENVFPRRWSTSDSKPAEYPKFVLFSEVQE